MSSEEAKYRKHTNQMGLSDNEGKELVGALQQIVESLLNKKFRLKQGTVDEQKQQQAS